MRSEIRSLALPMTNQQRYHDALVVHILYELTVDEKRNVNLRINHVSSLPLFFFCQRSPSSLICNCDFS